MMHAAVSLPIFVVSVVALLFIAAVAVLVVEHYRFRRDEAQWQQLMARIADYRQDFDR